MVKWLTRFVNNEPEYEGFDEQDLGNSLAAAIDVTPESEPRAPVLKPVSVLIYYDNAVEHQIAGLTTKRDKLEEEIAKLSQILHETKAAISGLNLARSSWSNQIPKQTEDHNADRFAEELTKRRNGTEATPTDKPIPMAEG